MNLLDNLINRSFPTTLIAALILCAPGARIMGESSPSATSKSLLAIDPSVAAENTVFTPTSGQISISQATDTNAPGLLVRIEPGNEDYPGFHFKPKEGPWNLSACGHIEAKVFNTGEKPIYISMRVDGKEDGGDYTSNTESTSVKPGESGVVKVIFGFTYGHKPGAKPNPAAISKLVFFTSKVIGVKESFRVASIVATGPAGEKPAVNPDEIRTKPTNGIVFGNGAGLGAYQLDAKEGATAELQNTAIKMTFAANKASWVTLRPKIGRWDFRDAFGVIVKFKNTGTMPLSLKARVNSNSGPTDQGTTSNPVAPGADGVIEVPFGAAISWVGIKDSIKTSWDGQKGTGTKFNSDTVSGITISPEPQAETQSILVTSVTVGALTPRILPDWLGKRPPVEGDWVKTFDENFDGSSLETARWNVYTENYWDKRSHFSKDNVAVTNGVAILHYEKKSGYKNDDATKGKTDYTTGFLDTYGKWVQRYGYFEARMKLTKAPGLWPAFWLMPDRGAAAGPQWVRSDTGNGGMEFDIMEYLGRWGPYRYNIAWHWDGYGKDHQQTGTTTTYFQPDKDGYVTAGLLWLPGLAVCYANGKEVARWESPRISKINSFIMFTLVSGGWDNNQLDDSKLPDDFTIDYVRAWQRKDLASEAADATK